MENDSTTMGRYLGLKTVRADEHITGGSSPSEEQNDQAAYRGRQRIREGVPENMETLREHLAGVLDDLREVVCD